MIMFFVLLISSFNNIYSYEYNNNDNHNINIKFNLFIHQNNHSLNSLEIFKYNKHNINIVNMNKIFDRYCELLKSSNYDDYCYSHNNNNELCESINDLYNNNLDTPNKFKLLTNIIESFMFIINSNKYCLFNYNGFSSFIDKIKNILKLDKYCDKLNELIEFVLKKIKNEDNSQFG